MSRVMNIGLTSRYPLQFLAIWLAVGFLFLLSPLFAPGSVSTISITVVLSYASILTVAAVGQTLVVQQGGLDLLVPGVFSLAAIIVSKYPHGENDQFVPWAALALLAGALSGLVNGLAITKFRITPFIASLAVNGLLYGLIVFLTKGISTQAVPPMLGEFAVGRVGVVSNLAIVAVIALVGVELVIFGGRGSFVGVLLSSVLIQEIMTATGFLDLGSAWQFWLPSVLILIAAAAFSRVRARAQYG
jgi:ribose transport system permease protein